MPIRIVFKPTKSDILRAAYLALRARPFTFTLSVGFFVIVPWIAAVAGIAAAIIGMPVDLFYVVVLIALPPLTVAFFCAIPLMQVRGARSLKGAHTYEFSETGIHLSGPSFDNRLEWSVLTRCWSFKPGILFLSGNAPLITVPARCLSAPAKAELRRLLSTYGVEMRGAWV